MSIFSGIEKDIKKGISKLGDSVKHEVQILGKEAKHEVEKLAVEAQHELSKAADNAEMEVTHLAKQAAQDVEHAAKEAKAGLEEGFHAAMAEALKAVSRGALHKALTVAKTLTPDQMGLSLGPVSMAVEDVDQRIDVLEKWTHNPPTDTHHIKELIREIAPTSVSVQIDVQVAALIVTTDDLSIGFSATWTTEGFLQSFDDIMAAF